MYRLKWLKTVCLLFVLSTASSNIWADNQKLIVLEGPKDQNNELIKQMVAVLKDKASIYTIRDPIEFKQKAKEIEEDHHEVILINQSSLAEQAKADVLSEEHDEGYFMPCKPTHFLFISHFDKQNVKTLSEKKLDPKLFNARYRALCKQVINELKCQTLCLELDFDQLAMDQLIDPILASLDLDLSILDPKNVTKSDKRKLRPFYLSWQAHLEPPIIESTGYISITPHPEKCIIEKGDKGQFQAMDSPFQYSAFSEPRHPPLSIGFLNKKASFDFPYLDEVYQIQDLPIAFPTETEQEYEYRLPKCLKGFEEFVQKTGDAWQKFSKHPHKYYAYLTVSHDIIPPFKSQRRPSVHSDGFKSARIKDEELCQYAFVVSNALPTIYYIESFDVSDLDPAKNDFFVAFSQRSKKDPVDCQDPYEIMMLDPYTLHAARPNLTLYPIKRTFARIIYTTRQFDRIGNAHNPAFDYQWEMVPRDAQSKLDLTH